MLKEIKDIVIKSVEDANKEQGKIMSKLTFKEKIRKLTQEFLLDWWSEDDRKNNIVDKFVEDIDKAHQKETRELQSRILELEQKLELKCEDNNTHQTTLGNLQAERKRDLLAMQKKVEALVGDILKEKTCLGGDGNVYHTAVKTDDIKEIAKSHGVKIK